MSDIFATLDKDKMFEFDESLVTNAVEETSNISVIDSTELTTDQKSVIMGIVDWYTNRSSYEPVFTVAGAAGTGKTSIIPHFIEELSLNKQAGHALPLTAKVLKRNGFIPIGSIKEGDEICGGNGQWCKVTGVFPQGKRQMYRIHFSDGSNCVCDKEHLWTIATKNEEFQTKSVAEIQKMQLHSDSGYIRYRIPLVRPVQFSEKSLPIHPYLLGVLAQGSHHMGDTITIRTRHPEIMPHINQLLSRIDFRTDGPHNDNDLRTPEYYVIPKKATKADNSLNDQLHILGMRNLSPHERFIPPIYLFGSVEQRRQLLNGLIDVFGTFAHKSDTKKLVDKEKKHNFTVEFMSQSLRLLKDIKFLVESLGGVTDLHPVAGAWKENGEVKYNSFDGWYKMSIKILPFKMRINNKEILEHCNLHSVLLNRSIKKIEELDVETEAVCIEVDEPNQLFVTDNFIVTHNTTVSKSNVAFCAYTGRAAMILQRKGIPASTIHKLIYDAKFETNSAGQVTEVKFVRKAPMFLRDAGIRLIVIDEFSMVSDELMKDLMSFKIPILMFGDPYQLQPVGGSTNPYYDKFDAFLSEIHRQAADNPILALATQVRNGNLKLNYGDYGNLKILDKRQLDKDVMMEADQVICGTNKSRQSLNSCFRAHLGMVGIMPNEGDKLICLKNNWEVKPLGEIFLVNGLIGYVSNVSVSQYGKATLDFRPDFTNDIFFDLPFEQKIFTGEQIQWKKPRRGVPSVNQFDYGYVITAHKSQGGEFPKVVIYEECMRREEHANWLYTAITRAQEECIIYH